MPLKLRALEEMLNPQPEAAKVLHGLLDWIGRADEASQRGEAAPPPTGLDGKSLFPGSDWWLTDIERRQLDQQKEIAPDDAEEELDEASGCSSADSAASWSSSECDSGASVPLGSMPRRRVAHDRVAGSSGIQASVKERPAPGQAYKRGRLIGKQPAPEQAYKRRRLIGKQPVAVGQSRAPDADATPAHPVIACLFVSLYSMIY